jgi:hypothetical protein
VILACRTTQFGSLVVGNVLLSQRFCSPIEESARLCFRSWDESYTRLRTQKDATQIYSIEDLKDQKLMELNTSTLSALRSLPKEEREGTRLFTIATDYAAGSDKKKLWVWSNLPVWAKMIVETREGSFFRIQNEKSSHLQMKNSNWLKWEVMESDAYLHVQFFQNDLKVLHHGIQHEARTFGITRIGPPLLNNSLDLNLKLRLGDEGWSNLV